jgi:Alanine dehydrogenase/PNT, N-terminal domain
MEQLSLGVVGTSRKRDERRLPIHPGHLGRIDADLRRRIFLERGYGQHFGVSDARLAAEVGGMRTREQLIEDCDVLLLPKPLAEDLTALRPGMVLWGWPHSVQDGVITQVAIDRRLTLIAWEAMNHWTDEGNFSLHVFHKNNELAGYCSVLHAMQLMGTTGAYGRRLRAAVISFGATARGAVTALFAAFRRSLRRSRPRGWSTTSVTQSTPVARWRSPAPGADRSPSSSPSTTSSSTASCRTQTSRSCS